MPTTYIVILIAVVFLIVVIATLVTISRNANRERALQSRKARKKQEKQRLDREPALNLISQKLQAGQELSANEKTWHQYYVEAFMQNPQETAVYSFEKTFLTFALQSIHRVLQEKKFGELQDYERDWVLQIVNKSVQSESKSSPLESEVTLAAMECPTACNFIQLKNSYHASQVQEASIESIRAEVKKNTQKTGKAASAMRNIAIMNALNSDD